MRSVEGTSSLTWIFDSFCISSILKSSAKKTSPVDSSTVSLTDNSAVTIVFSIGATFSVMGVFSSIGKFSLIATLRQL